MNVKLTIEKKNDFILEILFMRSELGRLQQILIELIKVIEKKLGFPRFYRVFFNEFFPFLLKNKQTNKKSYNTKQ